MVTASYDYQKGIFYLNFIDSLHAVCIPSTSTNTPASSDFLIPNLVVFYMVCQSILQTHACSSPTVSLNPIKSPCFPCCHIFLHNSLALRINLLYTLYENTSHILYVKLSPQKFFLHSKGRYLISINMTIFIFFHLVGKWSPSPQKRPLFFTSLFQNAKKAGNPQFLEFPA